MLDDVTGRWSPKPGCRGRGHLSLLNGSGAFAQVWGLRTPPSPDGGAEALWREKVALELSARLQRDRELLSPGSNMAPFQPHFPSTEGSCFHFRQRCSHGGEALNTERTWRSSPGTLLFTGLSGEIGRKSWRVAERWPFRLSAPLSSGCAQMSFVTSF